MELTLYSLYLLKNVGQRRTDDFEVIGGRGGRRLATSRRNLINGGGPLSPPSLVGEPLTRIREWINTFEDKRSGRNIVTRFLGFRPRKRLADKGGGIFGRVVRRGVESSLSAFVLFARNF